MTNAAAIATKLNVLESAIVRVEEWASVMFVVVKGLGARFVSKKVVEIKMKATAKRIVGGVKLMAADGKTYYNIDDCWKFERKIPECIHARSMSKAEIEALKSLVDELMAQPEPEYKPESDGYDLSYEMYNPSGRYYG